MSLSGYLPLPGDFRVTDAAKKTPVFQAHGDRDTVVKFDWADDARKIIQSQGVEKVVFKKYRGMGHELGPEEFHDIKEWLKTIFLPQGGA
jgi:predicted esterase